MQLIRNRTKCRMAFALLKAYTGLITG